MAAADVGGGCVAGGVDVAVPQRAFLAPQRVVVGPSRVGLALRSLLFGF